jgi:hypothetical protein
VASPGNSASTDTRPRRNRGPDRQPIAHTAPSALPTPESSGARLCPKEAGRSQYVPAKSSSINGSVVSGDSSIILMYSSARTQKCMVTRCLGNCGSLGLKSFRMQLQPLTFDTADEWRYCFGRPFWFQLACWSYRTRKTDIASILMSSQNDQFPI